MSTKFVQLIPTSDSFVLISKSKVALKQIPIDLETSNPIFNFGQKFIDDLKKISPLEMGSSVPYIALRVLKDNGEVLHDFNKELFFKQVDFTKINSGERFSDRPTASLVEMKIKTESGSGYIYFQDVSFQIKVHKPDIALNGTLIALLFPGMEMELEYGWRNSASQNELLNKSEKLLFQLKNYTINYSVDGQIDLGINGTAFSERFNNLLIGDEGEGIAALISAKEKGQAQLASEREKDQMRDILSKGTLTKAYNAALNYQDYLQNLKDNPDKTSVRAMDVIQSSLQSYRSVLERVRGKIRANFHVNFDQLKKFKDPGAQYQESAKKNNKKIKVPAFKQGMITIHDLVSTMCVKTLDAFSTANKGINVRVVYGLFHDEVGSPTNKKFKGKPIADFPIDYAEFSRLIGAEAKGKGTEVLTMEGLFTILINNFLHNEGHWRKLDSTAEGLRTPHIYLAINNYVVKKDTKEERFMDIALVDINRDVPLTSVIVEDLIKDKKGKATTNDIEQEIKKKAKNVPIVRLGHGNSFIRELSMSNIMDEYMKAALIKKMAENSSTDTRNWVPPGLQNAVTSVDTKTPLHLPLQGSMTVFGSTEWKPFRSFALLSGIFVIDGIYKILSVTHTLNNQGFFTNVEFMYH